jgi:thiol-disulfide isomerase/thioredoxin
MDTRSRRVRQSNELRRSVEQPGRKATWRWVMLAGGVALLLVVSWWVVGRGSLSPNPATAATPPLAADSRALAPDFTLTLLSSGQPFHLAAQEGKATLMLFTASWCSDCLTEIPKLAQIYKEKAGQGLNVLVIDIDPTESDSDLLGFKARAGGADHCWARDTDGKVTMAYNVRATDTKVVLDRSRRVVATTVGAVSVEKLRQYVEEALK